jgi:hypothetical protein
MKENLTLFFDDKNILSRNGFIRKLGSPKAIEIYKDPSATTATGFPSIWHDEQNGKYHMFYNGHVNGKLVPLAAISDDGIHFSPRNTAEEAGLNNPTAPNQVMIGCGELANVYVDKKGPSSERLKALVTYGDSKTTRIINDPLYTSPDGINWTRQPVQWHNHAAEPGAMCFYNHVIDKHFIIARPDAGVRRVGLIETSDFKSFSDARLVMTPDSLDEPLAEHYGMPVFPYENYFIGFLWIYHVPDVRKRKYYGGTIDAQLVYSYNGTNFNRTLREAFFSKQKGMIFPSCMYESTDGKLLVVASTCENEHGYFKNNGVIEIYEIRKDGFISLHADDNADLITIPMLYRGGDIKVNINAEHCTCALYTDDSDKHPLNLLEHELLPLEGFSHEECKAFSGDCLVWTPKWKEKDVNCLEGRIIYIELKLKKGDIYSIKGNLTPMMICDLARYHLHGIVPDITGIG